MLKNNFKRKNTIYISEKSISKCYNIFSKKIKGKRSMMLCMNVCCVKEI